MKNRVAVIGLGSMGWGAAVSLLREGFDVNGVDVRQDVLDKFVAAGGASFSTAAEAMPGVDVVFVFVVNSEQAKAVLFGPGGAVGAAQPGTLFVLCVTMAPRATIDISEKLHALGMGMLDAPVSGGQAKALTGDITIMASGAAADFEKAAAALDAVSARIFRLGDEVGLGSKVKMINQLLAGVHIAAAAEALTLAANVGLDLKTVYDVITVSAGSSWMFENRGAHIVEGDYAARSAVNIFVKDLGIVAESAVAGHASVPLTETALQLFKQAAAEGLGHEDDAAVAKTLARRSGTRIPGFEGT